MGRRSRRSALHLNNPAGLTKAMGRPLGAHTDPKSGELLIFDRPSHGIRALAAALLKLQDEQGQGTLPEIVHRFATFKGTDPARYLSAIAKVDNGRALDLHRYADLRLAVEAIIRGEQGRVPFSEAQLVKGLVLAGVEPEPHPLRQSRTLRAGITAMLLLLLALAGAGMRIDPYRAEALVRENAPALLPLFFDLQAHLTSLEWAFYAFLLVALGYMIWARLDDRRKGLR